MSEIRRPLRPPMVRHPKDDRIYLPVEYSDQLEVYVHKLDYTRTLQLDEAHKHIAALEAEVARLTAELTDLRSALEMTPDETADSVRAENRALESRIDQQNEAMIRLTAERDAVCVWRVKTSEIDLSRYEVIMTDGALNPVRTPEGRFLFTGQSMVAEMNRLAAEVASLRSKLQKIYVDPEWHTCGTDVDPGDCSACVLQAYLREGGPRE